MASVPEYQFNLQFLITKGSSMEKNSALSYLGRSKIGREDGADPERHSLPERKEMRTHSACRYTSRSGMMPQEPHNTGLSGLLTISLTLLLF